MRRWVNSLIVLVVGAMLAAGCTTAPPSKKLSEAPTKTGEYVIGPGDTLQVYVRNNPDLSVQLPVRPDGKISTPMTQDVQAVGKTPSKLADDLEGRLSEFIRNPIVSVIVKNFVGTYDDQIRILGEAVKPRAIAYQEGMTVLDAIIKVGGLTQFAAGDRTKLIRRRGDESETYTVRLDDLLNDGDISANVDLYPGDILIIPEAFF